jgi:hypothetical protein
LPFGKPRNHVSSNFKRTHYRISTPPCVPSSFSCTLPLMPRDAILLSDKRVPTIGIFCALCQRRETFDVESLKLKHGGDVKMPDLLALLVADCPKRQQRAFSVYDRCKAVYERR